MPPCSSHRELREALPEGWGRCPTWGLGTVSKPLKNCHKDERVKHGLDPHRRSVKEKQKGNREGVRKSGVCKKKKKKKKEKSWQQARRLLCSIQPTEANPGVLGL